MTLQSAIALVHCHRKQRCQNEEDDRCCGHVAYLRLGSLGNSRLSSDQVRDHTNGQQHDECDELQKQILVQAPALLVVERWVWQCEQ